MSVFDVTVFFASERQLVTMRVATCCTNSSLPEQLNGRPAAMLPEITPSRHTNITAAQSKDRYGRGQPKACRLSQQHATHASMQRTWCATCIGFVSSTIVHKCLLTVSNACHVNFLCSTSNTTSSLPTVKSNPAGRRSTAHMQYGRVRRRNASQRTGGSSNVRKDSRVGKLIEDFGKKDDWVSKTIMRHQMAVVIQVRPGMKCSAHQRAH
eukprot:361313-Chlamydomonas_euryale.AAC.3